MNVLHILDTCRESQEDRAKRVADRARFSAEPVTLTGWGDDLYPAPKRAPLDFGKIAREIRAIDEVAEPLAFCDCCGRAGVLALTIAAGGVETYACEHCRGEAEHITAEQRDEFERCQGADDARHDLREERDL